MCGIKKDDGYRASLTILRERESDVANQRHGKEEASEDTRKVFEEQEKQYGSILNTAKVYGLRPTIQKGVQALQAGILESGLIGGDLRHLLCMKAASINGCPY